MNATVAIPVEGEQIFQHFGKATTFRIYTVADGAVTRAEVLDTGGAGPEDLALRLLMRGVGAVICDGIGPGAQGALVAAGIVARAGVSGSADDALARFVAGALEARTRANCGHSGGGCGGRCGSCGHCR